MRYTVWRYFRKHIQLYTSFKIALIDEFKIPILGVKVWFEQLWGFNSYSLHMVKKKKKKHYIDI